MVEAIAQDRQSCQSVFCLMKNPQLYRSAGQLSASGREHDWLGFELKRKTAGGLLGYGTRVTEAARRLAAYVDRIVKGAQPADLPFEVVVRPELIVNLKTAQEISVTIPPEVLKRADRVIQ